MTYICEIQSKADGTAVCMRENLAFEFSRGEEVEKKLFSMCNIYRSVGSTC